MSYPSKQDIITAVKNPQFIKDGFLQGASSVLGRIGKPLMYSGGFSIVFPLQQGREKWAFRVWHVPLKDVKDRYIAISEYLNKQKLKYFAEFTFVEKGLLVNGQLLDTSRMQWVNGKLLKEYLASILTDKPSLEKLAEDFLRMNADLRKNSISHGDLQHDNIIITDSGEIKLIDYDSICVPLIQGEGELVTGLKGYQHPSRFKSGEASLRADFFSELIIYLSILALAEKPSLWEKYKVADTNTMLFEEEDFNDLEDSDIFKELQSLSPKINALLRILIDYLKEEDYLQLKPFSSYFETPVIFHFGSDKNYILDSMDTTLSWKVENAQKILIDQGVGEVTAKSEIKVRPAKATVYILRAVGFFEEIEESTEVRVFPTPVIESMFVPAPVIREKTNLQIRMPEFPSVNLSFNDVPDGIKDPYHKATLANLNISPFPNLGSNSVKPSSQKRSNISGLLDTINGINTRIITILKIKNK